MVASGPHLFGEFVPRGPGRPIPRAIIGVQIAGGETVAKDRGWLLKASNTLSNVLIVDEGDRELTYRVRRLGEKGARPFQRQITHRGCFEPRSVESMSISAR